MATSFFAPLLALRLPFRDIIVEHNKTASDHLQSLVLDFLLEDLPQLALACYFAQSVQKTGLTVLDLLSVCNTSLSIVLVLVRVGLACVESASQGFPQDPGTQSTKDEGGKPGLSEMQQL